MARRIKNDFEEKARDRRSIAIALACGLFAVLVFTISVLRMGGAHAIAPAPSNSRPKSAQAKNARLAIICVAVFVAMTGAAFAAVPLYQAFCQATGFDGTVRSAARRPPTPPRPGRPQGRCALRRQCPRHALDLRARADLADPEAGRDQARLFQGDQYRQGAGDGPGLVQRLPGGRRRLSSARSSASASTIRRSSPARPWSFQWSITSIPASATDPEGRSVGEITLSYTFYPAQQPFCGLKTGLTSWRDRR